MQPRSCEVVGGETVYSTSHPTGNSSFNKTCGQVNEMPTLAQPFPVSLKPLGDSEPRSSLSEPALNCNYNANSPSRRIQQKKRLVPLGTL